MGLYLQYVAREKCLTQLRKPTEQLLMLLMFCIFVNRLTKVFQTVLKGSSFISWGLNLLHRVAAERTWDHGRPAITGCLLRKHEQF